ncbi:hypothetical protein U1Q18_017595 [Sarracenia purpurea var. burkii]
MNRRFATVDGGGSRRGEAGGGSDCAERRRRRGRVGSEGGEPPRRRRNPKIQISARNLSRAKGIIAILDGFPTLREQLAPRESPRTGSSAPGPPRVDPVVGELRSGHRRAPFRLLLGYRAPCLGFPLLSL